uniref:Putative ovule protein n=1 Tax=Solanum chacoense TaxID=4108 RepID=A0A0V0GYV9_SOLCH
MTIPSQFSILRNLCRCFFFLFCLFNFWMIPYGCIGRHIRTPVRMLLYRLFFKKAFVFDCYFKKEKLWLERMC